MKNVAFGDELNAKESVRLTYVVFGEESVRLTYVVEGEPVRLTFAKPVGAGPFDVLRDSRSGRTLSSRGGRSS